MNDENVDDKAIVEPLDIHHMPEYCFAGGNLRKTEDYLHIF